MIKNKFLFCALLVVALSVGTAFADKKDSNNKKGYKFTVVINNATDTVIYLGQYYNKQQYAIDTAYLDKKKNHFVFEKKRNLKPGLYFLTNNKNQLAEFTINKEPLNYKFITDDANWTMHMQIKGSTDNERFLNYQHMRRDLNIRLDSAKAVMTDDDFKLFRRNMGKELDSLNSDFIEKNPDHILSIIMKATKEIDVPVVDSLGDTLTDQQR